MLERAGFEPRRGDAIRTHGSNPARCRLRKNPSRARRDFRPTDFSTWILLQELARLSLLVALMPVKNPAATHYTSQSLTTALIAGSDLVIVPLSGVIKKYK
jgi:hypothetical protein